MSDLGPLPAFELSKDVLTLTSPGFSLRWNVETPLGTPVFVTYSFTNSKSDYDTNADRQTFFPWLPDQIEQVRKAFDVWAEASGIVFLEVPDREIGQIRLALVDLSGQNNAVGEQLSGYAYLPEVTASGVIAYDTLGGDIFLNGAFYANDIVGLTPGNRGFSILLHEIGHAIGFKHPFEGSPRLDPARDNGASTVMSYNRPANTVSLGTLDIEASQLYYGASDGFYVWDPEPLSLTLYGTAGDDNLLGTELNDRFEGFGGADLIYGGPGDDWIYAGYGNDTLVGGQGNDTLDGAWGLDIAQFSGTLSTYGILSIPTGIEVRDKIVDRDGIDRLASIERLIFSDGTLAFDAEGSAGQVYRLYQAAFARTPDTPGLSHNVRLADEGVTLSQMSAAFLGSPEFKTKYPTWISDADYIQELYQNVLGRNADAAGLLGWQERLQDGSWTRSSMLVGFSESQENIDQLASKIGEGIWLI